MKKRILRTSRMQNLLKIFKIETMNFCLKFVFGIFLLFQLFPTISYGQSTIQLDALNGFKEFKLGDSYTKWMEDLLELNQTGKNNERMYKYVGSCCQSVFEFPVDGIILGFYNEKLVRIAITLQNFQEYYDCEHTIFGQQGYPELKSNFTALFGEQTGFNVASESQMRSNQQIPHILSSWTGDKVKLLIAYYYIGVQDGDYVVVLVSDVAFYKMKLESGF
jgi:hypothetical protein